jgi:hypothetical protein
MPLFETLTLSHCASNPSGWEGGGPLQVNACNIGLREIIAFEKKGQVPLPRERIGETVSVVQPGRMSPLAVPPPSLARDLCLVLIDWSDFNARAIEQ